MAAKKATTTKIVSGEPERIQLAVRLDRTIIRRLELLTSRFARPGLVITRTDVLRMALLEGLTTMEEREKQR